MAKPRTFSLLFAAVTVFSSLLTAQGELLVYEPFDYPDGIAPLDKAVGRDMTPAWVQRSMPTA